MQLDTWVGPDGKEVDTSDPNATGPLPTTLFFRKLRRNPAFRNTVLKGLVRARATARQHASEEYYATAEESCGMGMGMPSPDDWSTHPNRWDIAAKSLDAEIIFVVECSFGDTVE